MRKIEHNFKIKISIIWSQIWKEIKLTSLKENTCSVTYKSVHRVKFHNYGKYHCTISVSLSFAGMDEIGRIIPKLTVNLYARSSHEKLHYTKFVTMVTWRRQNLPFLLQYLLWMVSFVWLAFPSVLSLYFYQKPLWILDAASLVFPFQYLIH